VLCDQPHQVVTDSALVYLPVRSGFGYGVHS
jgi:hypothetical protein